MSNLPNQKYTKRLEIVIYSLFLLLGGFLITGSVFISLSQKSIENSFLSLISSSLGGVLIAIGLTSITTTFFEFGSLNDVKISVRKLIDQGAGIRISSVGESEFVKLSSLVDKILYRYVKTWNSTNNSWVWRVKKIVFSFSEDKKRVVSKLTNKSDSMNYYYDIQVAYINNHLVFIMDDKYKSDEPIIEIYSFMGRLKDGIYSGLGFRQSLPPNTQKLISPSIISSSWIATLKDIPDNINTWESNSDESKILDEEWAQSMYGTHFDGISKIIDEFDLG
jgi:hypothetical protein